MNVAEYDRSQKRGDLHGGGQQADVHGLGGQHG